MTFSDIMIWKKMIQIIAGNAHGEFVGKWIL